VIIDRLNIYIEEGKKKKRKEGKVLRSDKVITAVIFFDGLNALVYVRTCKSIETNDHQRRSLQLSSLMVSMAFFLVIA
jgi:hypothetical protein